MSWSAYGAVMKAREDMRLDAMSLGGGSNGRGLGPVKIRDGKRAVDQSPRTIAALYVDRRGVYRRLPGVELWHAKRDARLYNGPHPVVAHPPCARWCRLSGLVEARWGHKRGEDGGCFEAALAAVRRWGGVLEHPAWSHAWPAFGLPEPPLRGGWQRGLCGGWSCHVEQGRYGHQAKKATWLYAFGVSDLPSLRWGLIADKGAKALVSWCGNRVSGDEKRPRLAKKLSTSTPTEFRDVLIDIARRVDL